MTGMEPEAFVAKWRANQRMERAAAQEHFIDLCSLLGEPTPNSDPDGSTYAFEKGATKATGGEGWADVWRRGCFGWEYKGKHRDLDAAHRQLLLYAGALENPPLLVVSDIERIIVRTNWTNAVSARHDFQLDDLRDPIKRALLKSIWSEPDRLRPAKTRQALTEEAAADFAEVAGRLRRRGHDAHMVAHFINRLVFCLFADDVGLLPNGLLERMLSAAQTRPQRFVDFAARLFRAMKDRGGEIDFTPVQWFNGGLFNDDTALPLELDDIRLLNRVASLDWAEVDPSILGTLFERGLDPDKRSQLGAHYTDREKISRLVEAAVERPLLAEWEVVKAEIIAADERATAATAARAKNRARQEMREAYQRFLDRLRGFRVLDPACGSGNFLYVSLLALKDLELRASVEAEALGLPREFHQVGPEAVHGIEVNPYAAELARVSVWIGHIQWARRNGLPPPSNPVLRPLDTIECRDAVLGADGKPAPWPKADSIVGNPPFLGNKGMIRTLGEDYTDRLRTAFKGRLPAGVDLVCYWFELARQAIAEGHSTHVAMVATQSIRKGASRVALDRVQKDATIFEAWSDEPWTVDGADVRVSLLAFSRSYLGPFKLDGKIVTSIHADLSSGGVDLTKAHPLRENQRICFQGTTKGGDFDIAPGIARQWLKDAPNANGRPNADVVKPWRNALDIVRRPGDGWIIDFGATMTAEEASFYASPFAHVVKKVKPHRDTVRRDAYRLNWWRHVEPRPGLRRALQPLSRYIATPRVAKHRIFVWLDKSVLPDSRVYAIARDDDVCFGILHSRFHEAWALAQGSRHGVGNDPTYNNQTCFETFPFPMGLTLSLPAAGYAADPRAEAIGQAARELVAARDRWLNPVDLITWQPEVVPGFPARPQPISDAAATALKKRTLTSLYNTRGTPEGAWLDSLHQRLDVAVAAAYGWPADISREDALAALLVLNLQRSAAR